MHLENDLPKGYIRSEDHGLFEYMCDIVASDRLVCITGAGISRGLPLKDDGKKTMPSWFGLLKELQNSLKDKLNEEDRNDLDRLIVESAPGQALIEAASILRTGREMEFDQLLRKAVTHIDKKTTKTHEALLDLHPRGFLTFNYDLAHENSFRIRKIYRDWDIMLYNDEDKIKNALGNALMRPFLLKAHGSLEDPENEDGSLEASKTDLVLTKESYRDLFIKYPAYRAFVQNILTNFDLLIVGFGLSDPDFDEFIQNILIQFGSPLRDCIVISKDNISKDKGGSADFRDILLRRRFKIHTLHIDKYENIPYVITESMKRPGPKLNEMVEHCLSDDLNERSQAHKNLQQLGIAGKSCATSILINKIKSFKVESLSSSDVRYMSELIYSLGKVDPDMNQSRDLIISLIDKLDHAEPIAHALAVFQTGFTPEDLPQLDSWLNKFKTNRLKCDDLNPDPDYRVLTYLEYLIHYVKAKHIKDSEIKPAGDLTADKNIKI